MRVGLIPERYVVILFGLLETYYSDDAVVQEQQEGVKVVVIQQDTEKEVCQVGLDQQTHLFYGLPVWR